MYLLMTAMYIFFMSKLMDEVSCNKKGSSFLCYEVVRTELLFYRVVSPGLIYSLALIY